MRKTTALLCSALLAAPAFAQPASDAPDPGVAQSQTAVTQEQIEAIRNQLKREEARIDLDTIFKSMKDLRQQREQLLLEEAGARGRRRGLEEAIDRYTALTRSRAGSDPVVAELEKVVDVRQQQLARTQQLYKAASVSMTELNAAEAALATSRAELASVKERAAGGTPSGQALDGWNREAINLSIDAQDRQARLDYIAARLKMLDRVRDDWMELAHASDALDPHARDSGRKKTPSEIQEMMRRTESDYAALAALPTDTPASQPANHSALREE